MIAYERPDRFGYKESHYRLIEVPEPGEMLDALAAVLNISIVVSKTRQLFILKGVRIHLDRVEGLGDFIEFEGIAADGDDPSLFAELLNDLRQCFGIMDGDLVPVSYSDLLRPDSRA